ncbi:hypothetical protein ARTHRO_40806 [Limnospira indica PCC 8005]|uniref:Uncharacterized protein n=1 Tax=Limnospira indica PCC 8005 TaxID=376219 RepID=A0A9P1KIU4_9CYAN|nr:hypothetical protein ARTHRO_40806 [Limnospira indica PCC 8005]
MAKVDGIITFMVKYVNGYVYISFPVTTNNDNGGATGFNDMYKYSRQPFWLWIVQ